MSGARRLPLEGLVLVLTALGSFALESTASGVRIGLLAVMAAHVCLHLVPLRIQLDRDRARIFATVGIIGYIVFGFGYFDLLGQSRQVTHFLTGLKTEGQNDNSSRNHFILKIGTALLILRRRCNGFMEN